MSYEKQLWLKQQIIEENFQRIKNKIPEIVIEKIIWSPLERWYRNKIEFSFGKFIKKVDVTSIAESVNVTKTTKPEFKLDVLSERSIGFHKQWEFSKIVDIDHCDLIGEESNQIYNYFKKLLKDSQLPVHDQMRHEWFFRHLVIREWKNTNQVLVNLAVYDKFLEEDKKYQKQREKLLNELKTNDFIQKNVTTLVVTYNNWLADVINSRDIRTEIIFGDGYIFEELRYISWEFRVDNWKLHQNPQPSTINPQINVKFRVSPFSFFQTNTAWAQTLFWTAMKMIWNIDGTILDLYCWTGSIWLSLLKCWIWKDLVWIEIVAEAIQDARYNAELNDMKDKVYFVSSPAEKILTNPDNEINWKLKNLWLVVIDPPRDWLHKDVVNFLIELKKKYDYKLLYISCNPVTMARDINLFSDWWILLKGLQPVDMFPQTHHIECIGILE